MPSGRTITPIQAFSARLDEPGGGEVAKSGCFVKKLDDLANTSPNEVFRSDIDTSAADGASAVAVPDADNEVMIRVKEMPGLFFPAEQLMPAILISTAFFIVSTVLLGRNVAEWKPMAAAQAGTSRSSARPRRASVCAQGLAPESASVRPSRCPAESAAASSGGPWWSSETRSARR